VHIKDAPAPQRPSGDARAGVRIVDVRQRVVPLAEPIANSYVSFRSMTASVVAVVSDVVRDGRPVVGYGFNSNGRYAQAGLLGERFIPRLLAAAPSVLRDETGHNLDPARVWEVLMADEKPGGHGERSVAVGVLDMAIWDLVAKLEEKPLHRLLADRYGDGSFDERVFVYAAGGYYSAGKSEATLRDEMGRYLDEGYTTVKLKIAGAPLKEDLRRIEAVVDLVGSVDRVAVDANGRLDQPQALAYGEALAPYGLRWYEEAGDPLDFQLQAALAECYEGPLATGENLFSRQDAQNLLRYGGMRADRDVLQFDPALAYGLTEFLRILEVVREHGFSARNCIPHGGHQFALAIASGLGLGGNESYPDVFQPFGGFADSTPIVDGHVAPCESPGIGIEEKASLRAVFEELTA
jgi:L-alanine-DL-glutamate epimerase-like enolase superfamily enzyme